MLRKLTRETELASAENEQLIFLNKVERQIDRLTQIVDQLLDVSRVEKKDFSLTKEPMVLADVIKSVIERLAPALNQAKCLIQVNIPQDLKGNWDQLRIEQVIENLLSNAIKYAPGKPITVSASQLNEVAEIEIKDEGPGIDPAKQKLIFERFVCANELPQVQGLGLGLFITRKIVEAHRGTVRVRSDPGTGTSFLISLPLENI